jgi:hypothetical protein
MPDLTPDDLRAAAKLRREQAAALPPGPWRTGPAGGYPTAVLVDGNGFYVIQSPLPPALARYMSSVHPDVGLAVADVLDAAADWQATAGEWPQHEAVRSCGRQLAALLAPALRENPGV